MKNNFFKHIGVLGMHWGVRKNTTSNANSSTGFKTSHLGALKRPKVTIATSSDHQKAAAIKKKRLSELSNDELTVLTKRLQLERQYKDLSKADLSPAKKFLSETLQATGKQLASKYLANITEAAGKALLDILKEKFKNP